MSLFSTSALGLLCVAGLAMAAPSAPVAESPSLIPQPVFCRVRTGMPGFSLAGGIRVDVPTTYSEVGRAAIRALQAAELPVLPAEPVGDFHVRVLTPEAVQVALAGQVVSEEIAAEYHTIRVTPDGIELEVASEAALPLAAQTLAQSLCRDEAGQVALPTMTVRDYPLLAHRGLLLDCARNPQSLDEIRRMLRVMARYKLNRLHWHLTDDQGWRLEILGYPRLTSVGGARAESPLPEDRTRGDGRPLTAFYTQGQVREIVEYAHQLGIIVIPEIEVPGHSSAALAAYPELGNSDVPGYAPKVSTVWGVQEYILAPKPETFRFLDAVLEEVCALFPRAPYIHIGGDEVPTRHWEESAAAQAFMRREEMQGEEEIQHYFTHRVADMLRRRGRGFIGWDEILEDPDLPSRSIVMVWRDQAAARRAAERGARVILCPTSHCYLDYSQGKDPADPAYHGLGRATGKDWRHLYSLDPTLPGEWQKQVLGIQGNAWGEAIHNADKLEYMVVPRICALAEVAWRAPEDRQDVEDFERRLLAQYPYFDKEGLNFRQEDGTPRRQEARRENR